ncbi:hypothetical protein GGR51DRAFT_332818 [Nemania sp. FL0031]|nr:hypothetical protein GGR51DRAFT_332818 [Nemania sp. FL0031]
MGNSPSREEAERKKFPDLPILRNQRKWNVVKVVLRSICLALSIIDVAELIAIQTASNALDYWPSVAYPVLAGFILWDVIEFVVIVVRGSTAKGVHPGAHVGVELILWLGSVFTITIQGIKANWGELGAPDWVLEERDLYPWVQVALTQFSFLSLLALLRFVFFVRACVEVDRRKKDRRLQQLVFAIQEQGRDPQDVPLSAFRAVRESNHVSSHTVLKALSTSTSTQSTTQSKTQSEPSTSTIPPQRPRSAPDERDFAYKYNFPITTVPELLESGIHPEDARNQKVLIGAFPR